MHTESLTPWQHEHVFGQGDRQAGERRVLLVVLLTGAMMGVEIVGGLAFGSMALLADGLHMGSHLVALGTAWLAYLYARRHATDRQFTFGTGKVNALAGYSSAVLLLLFAILMAVQSTARLIAPVPIDFDEALLVAVIGLIVNAGCAWLLADDEHGPDHRHDHNLKAAYLHILADLFTSLLAILALLGGRFFAWTWLDAAVGIVGALVIARWSQGLIRSTAGVLLDREAAGRTIEPLRRAIEVGNDRVADLHVWSLGGEGYAAAIAIVTDAPMPPDHYKRRIPASARIIHATVEVHHCDAIHH